MGGGVGLTVHGMYRVATENTLFAMPETAIGFFPDVGGTFFLPKLDNHMGMYFALTGSALKGQDVYHAGIATHFVPSTRIEMLKARLCDVSLTPAAISDSIDDFSAELEPFSLEPLRVHIEECFGKSSVTEIISSVESKLSSSDKNVTSWAQKTLKELKAVSPLSLQVTFALLKQNVNFSLNKALQVEYSASQAFMVKKILI